ncbi:MAG: hypothetical protein N2554_05465 [Fimbriimonadales bacterium]|nr:hypothetical protein [Fimbriimonadales bacterium]
MLADPEPAALILVAFKRAAQTKRKAQLRLQARMELLRLTVERGYTEEQTSNLLGLLEWIMDLPKLLGHEYERALEEYKRETGVKIVPRIVEMSLREGIDQGLQQGLQLNIVSIRFGHVPKDIVESIRQIHDADRLLALQAAALKCETLAAFREQLLDALEQEKQQNTASNGQS